jgi:transposase
MYLRETKGSNKSYLHIVEGVRDGKKVKQKILLSLGIIGELDNNKMLNMIKKLLSYLNHDYINLSEIKNDSGEEFRRNWGIIKILDKLFSIYKMDDFIESSLKDRKLKSDIKGISKLILADRLLDPKSKLKSYIDQNFYNGIAGIELHTIYRALDFWASVKEEIVQHLFEQNFKGRDVDIVYFDVTTLYFESQKQDALRKFGYGKDGNINEIQIVFSLVVDCSGIPVGFDIFTGNTYEGHTLLSSINRMQERYKINKVIIVADRGIGSEDNLRQIREAGYEYIIGTKLRSASVAVKKEAVDLNTYTKMGKSNESPSYKYIIRKDKEGKEITIDKLVAFYDIKRAQKDKKDRQRLVDKARDILAEGKVEGKRGSRKYIKTVKKIEKAEMQIDEKKIEADASWDGIYGIRSNSDRGPGELMTVYHQLWKIEESFRILKTTLEVRPMYHWTSKRIIGHLTLSYMAFVFERYLETNIYSGDESKSCRDIRETILGMQFSKIKLGEQDLYISAPVDALGDRILKFLGIKGPERISKTLPI